MNRGLVQVQDNPPSDVKCFCDRQGRYVVGQRYPDPPVLADETTTLLGFLERQRATVAWKCNGLDASSLGAMTTGSGMTLGGMLKHLTRFEDDMATEWLHGVPQLPPWNAVDWEAEPDWDWRSAVEDSPGTVANRRGAVSQASGGRVGPLQRAAASGIAQHPLHSDQHDRSICASQWTCRPDPRVDRRAGWT